MRLISVHKHRFLRIQEPKTLRAASPCPLLLLPPARQKHASSARARTHKHTPLHTYVHDVKPETCSVANATRPTAKSLNLGTACTTRRRTTASLACRFDRIHHTRGRARMMNTAEDDHMDLRHPRKTAYGHLSGAHEDGKHEHRPPPKAASMRQACLYMHAQISSGGTHEFSVSPARARRARNGRHHATTTAAVVVHVYEVSMYRAPATQNVQKISKSVVHQQEINPRNPTHTPNESRAKNGRHVMLLLLSWYMCIYSTGNTMGKKHQSVHTIKKSNTRRKEGG